MIEKRIYNICKKEVVDTPEVIEVIEAYIKFMKNKEVTINPPQNIVHLNLMVSMYTEASVILQTAYEEQQNG